MLKWIPVVEQIEVEVVCPQELIYTKGAKQENRLLSQLVISWLD